MGYRAEEEFVETPRTLQIAAPNATIVFLAITAVTKISQLSGEREGECDFLKASSRKEENTY